MLPTQERGDADGSAAGPVTRGAGGDKDNVNGVGGVDRGVAITCCRPVIVVSVLIRVVLCSFCIIRPYALTAAVTPALPVARSRAGATTTKR